MTRLADAAQMYVLDLGTTERMVQTRPEQTKKRMLGLMEAKETAVTGPVLLLDDQTREVDQTRAWVPKEIVLVSIAGINLDYSPEDIRAVSVGGSSGH